MFKKVLSGIMALSLISSFAAISASAASKGDVDGSGNIDIEDAVAVISHVNGVKSLSSSAMKLADVDSNGEVDIVDAVAIISHVNGVKPIGGSSIVTKKKIYWDEYGMFFIDHNLLGMTYPELCKALSIDLDPPKNWPYWGTNLKWISYDDFEKPAVIFIFQDGKCSMIYNDQKNKMTNGLKTDIKKRYGSEDHAIIEGKNCTYSAYMETYSETGEVYLRQEYQSLDMYW